MVRIDFSSHWPDGDPVSRRAAFHGLGGGLLATALTAMATSAGVRAQAGTPDPSATGPAPYLIIRLYELADGADIEDLMRRIDEGFVPIIRKVPGFIAYFYMVDRDTGITATVSAFTDESGAEESTRRAASWIEENSADVYQGPPDVFAGEIAIQAFGEIATDPA